jgi:hypothetical protein
MGANWDTKLPQEFTYPATVGLLVVLATVLVLFVISNWNARKFLGGEGTKFIVDEDGNHVVRR